MLIGCRAEKRDREVEVDEVDEVGMNSHAWPLSLDRVEVLRFVTFGVSSLLPVLSLA